LGYRFFLIRGHIGKFSQCGDTSRSYGTIHRVSRLKMSKMQSADSIL
jgi:hypothetical protein